MFSRKIKQSLAVGIAAIAVGLGAFGAVSATSGNSAHHVFAGGIFSPPGLGAAASSGPSTR
jgi:hypothetical protein